MESETNKHIDSQKISQPFVDKLIIPFDYVDDLILVVNKDKKLIHFSKSVTSLLECSDEELVNIDVYNLFPENLKEKIVSYFNSENHNYFEDLPLISKNGQENFFEIKLSKGYWYNEEATFAILRNINERKKAEEQIKQSHILYSTTVNAIKEWIYVIDKNLNIVLVNDALINIHKELNLPVNIVGANLCEIYNFLPEEIISDHKLIFKTGK